MTHIPTGRQASPHLRLTPAEVKARWKKGDYTPQGYLHHLILAHRKPGWAWRIDNVSEFCREWGFARRTFYRAKAALIAEGILSEEIFGGLELTLNSSDDSTDDCVTSDTPASDKAQPVPDETQLVPDEAQSVPSVTQPQAESLAIQGVCNPTSLNKLNTTTTQSGRSSDDVKNSEVRTLSDKNRLAAQVKNAGSPNQAKTPDKDTYAPPILLAAKKKIGINLNDRPLRMAVEQWPERVESAIAVLEERADRVQSPTRFLVRAIQQGWQPEVPRKTNTPGFGQWYREAYTRHLVTASQRMDGILKVLMACDQWIPYDLLQSLSWEEIAHRFGPREAGYATQ